MAKTGLIKPIETLYQGYRFRSRLEARWAVFFEALGLTWEYEPEGFELGGGERYLPDFRITAPGGEVAWYEVKPMSGPGSNSADCGKLRRLAAGLQWDRWAVLRGDPVDWFAQRMDKTVCVRCGLMDASLHTALYGTTARGMVTSVYYCEPCDFSPSRSVGSRNALVGGRNEMHKGLIECPRGLHLWHSRIVESAADEARQARFEHNDRPRGYR